MSEQSEDRARKLAEELNRHLNKEFASRADYRDAIEEVYTFFEDVLIGLDSDARDDDEGA